MKTTNKNKVLIETPVLAGAMLVLGATFAAPSLAEFTQVNAATRVPADPVVLPGHRTEFDATTLFVQEQVRSRLPATHTKFASSLAQTILQESRRYGFDPLMILAVIQHESRFSPTVRGGHGEIGLMQIKPSTAKWLKEKGSVRMPASMPVFNWEKTLADPSSNVRVGVAYLAMLRERFPSGGGLYLTAYNMGVTKLNRSLSRNERPRIYASKVMDQYQSIFAEYRKKELRTWPSMAMN